MAGSVNKVILIGNLGADPEVRALESGQKVAQLSVATNRAYNNRDGQRIEETEWHRVTFWGRLAETCERFLKKGSTLYVEGRLRTRKWTDQSGAERYMTEIVGETMTMLGGRQEGQSSGASQPAQPLQSTPPTSATATPQQPVALKAEEDDLPF